MLFCSAVFPLPNLSNIWIDIFRKFSKKKYRSLKFNQCNQSCHYPWLNQFITHQVKNKANFASKLKVFSVIIWYKVISASFMKFHAIKICLNFYFSKWFFDMWDKSFQNKCTVFMILNHKIMIKQLQYHIRMLNPYA